MAQPERERRGAFKDVIRRDATEAVAMSVDDYLADASYQGQRVRLHGIVGQENLSADARDEHVEFELAGDTRKIHVRYAGVVPNTFRVGGEVVVTGRMGKDGVFEAKELLTKCASKYEMKRTGKERPV